MTYEIIIPKVVQKQLNRLRKDARTRIETAIASLADNPRPYGVIKLKGYTDWYRIRIGDYRVLYRIQDKALLILVISVASRQEAYKD